MSGRALILPSGKRGVLAAGRGAVTRADGTCPACNCGVECASPRRWTWFCPEDGEPGVNYYLCEPAPTINPFVEYLYIGTRTTANGCSRRRRGSVGAIAATLTEPYVLLPTPSVGTGSGFNAAATTCSGTTSCNCDAPCSGCRATPTRFAISFAGSLCTGRVQFSDRRGAYQLVSTGFPASMVIEPGSFGSVLGLPTLAYVLRFFDDFAAPTHCHEQAGNLGLAAQIDVPNACNGAWTVTLSAFIQVSGQGSCSCSTGCTVNLYGGSASGSCFNAATVGCNGSGCSGIGCGGSCFGGSDPCGGSGAPSGSAAQIGSFSMTVTPVC